MKAAEFIRQIEKELHDAEGIYSEEVREDMLDNDQLTPREEAFMRGWDQAG